MACHFICFNFKYKLISEPCLPNGHFLEKTYYISYLTFIEYSVLYRLFLLYLLTTESCIV